MDDVPTPDPTADIPPAATPAGPRLRSGARDTEHRNRDWALTDFVDLETLQRIQDGFAELCNAAVSIRDADGNRITAPSCPNRFCLLITGKGDAEEKCRLSNAAASAAAAKRGRPAKYVCHAGLTQYAASIELDGHVLATLVLGDRPARPFERREVDALAREFDVDADELWEAAREIRQWSDDEMRAGIKFLQLLANTITSLCYGSAVLQERIEELAVLDETARMLSSGFNLDTVLKNITRTMVEVMNVKACSLRLLDEDGRELIMRAAYGLSPDYLKKGPVLVDESENDRKALANKVVRIRDMAAHRHVRYPAEARREGLISSLAIGLFAGGKPVGTLHIYTGVLHKFTDEEVRLFRSVAAQAAAAIQNSRLLEEYVAKVQIEHELQVASEVQRRMLPKTSPNIPGLDIHAVSLFSKQVGGDFYDYIPMPDDRTGIAIADTVGKSVPAAIMTASVRSALKAQAQNVFSISRVVNRVNTMLCEDTLPSEFVTLFYGVVNSETKRMAYCNAGHDPPMLVRDGNIQTLDVGGPLLGVMCDAKFDQASVQLEKGDVLLMYTDGVIDALSYAGERYSRDRLTESLLRHAAKSSNAEELTLQILWDVRRFAGFRIRTDDLTLVVVRVVEA
jgi:phosphoserine phosphatase RsbU/P